VYPGAPAMDADQTYKTNKIDVLRVEYFRLQSTGVLQQLNEDPGNLSGTKNAFSAANVKDIKAYSSEQLVTVAGDHEGLRALSAAGKITTAVSTLTAFVVKNGLTGVDIDIEGFGSWTAVDYTTYKSFLKALSTAMHSSGKKLAVCFPNWSSPFDQPPLTCGWKWGDFVPFDIDYVTPMMYDWQWDQGGGTPVAPIAWISEWSTRLITIFGADKLVIGLPSYGYVGTRGKWDIKILTLEQIKAVNGYDGGKRDAASAEVFKDLGGKVYVSNDSISLNAKRKAAEAKGIKMFAVWHLGGRNEWF